MLGGLVSGPNAQNQTRAETWYKLFTVVNKRSLLLSPCSVVSTHRPRCVRGLLWFRLRTATVGVQHACACSCLCVRARARDPPPCTGVGEAHTHLADDPLGPARGQQSRCVCAGPAAHLVFSLSHTHTHCCVCCQRHACHVGTREARRRASRCLCSRRRNPYEEARNSPSLGCQAPRQPGLFPSQPKKQKKNARRRELQLDRMQAYFESVAIVGSLVLHACSLHSVFCPAAVPSSKTGKYCLCLHASGVLAHFFFRRPRPQTLGVRFSFFPRCLFFFKRAGGSPGTHPGSLETVSSPRRTPNTSPTESVTRSGV